MTYLLALLALPIFYFGMRFERWRHKREYLRRERTPAAAGSCCAVSVKFRSPEDPARFVGV